MLSHTPDPDKRHLSNEAIVSQDLLRLSSDALSKLRFGPDFIKPAYESYCFANLPGFISELLTNQQADHSLPPVVRHTIGEGIERVVLVFFDAFGWESLQRHSGDSTLLKAFATDGHIVRTTSQFPSTTAAHVTTLATGLPVYEHGIYEWFYYEPNAGRVINPFKLTPYDKIRQNLVLLDEGYRAADILPDSSFSENLSSRQVTTRLYSPSTMNGNPYDLNFYRQGQGRPYQQVHDGCTQLLKEAKALKGPQFHYLYVDAYDNACHKYGPNRGEADEVATKLLSTLELLLELNRDGKTLLMLTADHGQVPIIPENEIIINELIPNLIGRLQTGGNGQPIRFAGSSRDLFLHVEEEHFEGTLGELRSALSGRAEILSLQEATSLGILGPQQMSVRFKERLGNILILPHREYSVSWLEPGVFEREFYLGKHGGLTREEMETQLCLLRL